MGIRAGGVPNWDAAAALSANEAGGRANCTGPWANCATVAPRTGEMNLWQIAQSMVSRPSLWGAGVPAMIGGAAMAPPGGGAATGIPRAEFPWGHAGCPTTPTVGTPGRGSKRWQVAQSMVSRLSPWGDADPAGIGGPAAPDRGIPVGAAAGMPRAGLAEGNGDDLPTKADGAPGRASN